MVLSPDYSNRALAAGLRREQKMARRPTNPMELSVSDAASLGRISHGQTQARRQQSNVIRPTSLNRKTERRYSKVHHHAAPKASQRTMVNSLRAMHEEKSELEHQETASFSRETLKQISVIRTRLRHDTSHVLDPSGPYMRRWDLVTTFCLVFTAIVTPVEVGFVVQARPNPRTPLFWINRAIDCVFLKDIVLNFNLAYVDDTKGNMLVKSRRAIAKRYVRSWFAVDFISTLPFEVVTMLAGDTERLKGLKMIRMIRLLRLLKLARVIRASRIVSRWESSFSVSYAHLTVMRLGLLLTTVAHWMACLWGLSATSAVRDRAGKESEIPNFKGSDLGRFRLVSADFWTSDHLSERSRSMDAFSGTRARGTLTLKRR